MKTLKEKYDKLVAGIESAQIYDGRNTGVDVYVCEECRHRFYTRYKDKGVTPFTIKCRNCEHGTAVHKDTISEQIANLMCFEVHNWVRPTFDQLQKLSEGAIRHVLDGGLMLDDELDSHKLKDKKMKANDAPEKIYLDEDESWHLTNPNGDSIEYTRTDALIEKACEKLRQFMYDGLMYQGRLERDKVIDNCIKDFKKLLKEE